MQNYIKLKNVIVQKPETDIIITNLLNRHYEEKRMQYTLCCII